MNTNIEIGKFRYAYFTGIASNGAPVSQFNAPVTFTLDDPTIATIESIDDDAVKIVGVAPGTTNFTATGTWNGFASSVAGSLTVSPAATGFSLQIEFSNQLAPQQPS